MWKVRYLNTRTGLTVVRSTEYHSRKSARLWCKGCMHGTDFVLISPEGAEEKFEVGVSCES